MLVMTSFAHVLAGPFCPRALGRECCFARTTHQTHCQSSSDVHHAVADMHLEGMSMDSMNQDDMSISHTSLNHNDMDHTVIDAVTADLSLHSDDAQGGETVTNTFEQPVESCAHCLGHSGIINAPISLVVMPDQSNKGLGSVPLLVSRFPGRPAITLAQIGLPREHAPPGGSAPRRLLINVFLI